MDKLIMVTGIPFSGKSDFIQETFDNWTDIVSLENIIYDMAEYANIPITEGNWNRLIKAATLEYNKELTKLCLSSLGAPTGTVVVDGDFLTVRNRLNFINNYTTKHEVVAIRMPTPSLEQLADNIVKSGKFFTLGWLKDKINLYRPPSEYFEHFDLVVDADDPDLMGKIWGNH